MRLLYFAWVRVQVGKNAEEMTLPAHVTTVRALAEYLATRGEGYAQAFADPARLRAAVNQQHVGFESPLSDEDEVAFFPPVTGG